MKAEVLLRRIGGVLALTIVAGLAYPLVQNSHHSGLAVMVAAAERAAVTHPVTVVLLDARAFDTLLEVGVLLLAVIAALILAHGEGREPSSLDQGPRPSPLLTWLVPRLAPIIGLVASYLLWAGATRPGGAFQGGTVLAAGGLILLLAKQLQPPPLKWPIRLWLCAGLLPFLTAGLLTLILGGNLLEYPEGLGKTLILVIEIGIMLSTALSFVVLALGVLLTLPSGNFPGDDT